MSNVLWLQDNQLLLSDDLSSVLLCDTCPCEIESGPCSPCEGGEAPLCWQLEAEGFVDGTGTNASCENANGTFFITVTSDPPEGDPCLSYTGCFKKLPEENRFPSRLKLFSGSCTGLNLSYWSIGLTTDGIGFFAIMAIFTDGTNIAGSGCVRFEKRLIPWDECFNAHTLPFLSSLNVSSNCCSALPSSIQLTPVNC